MKKLILTLLLLLLVPSVLAQGVTLTLSKPEAAQGEVLVDVSISEVEEFGSATFVVDYRKNVLTLTGGRAGGFAPGAVIKTSKSTGNVEVKIRTGEYTGSGQLVRLVFTPIEEREVTIRLKNIKINNRHGMEISSIKTSNEVKYTPGEEEEEVVEEVAAEVPEEEIAEDEEEAPPLEEWEEEIPLDDEEEEAPPLEEWEEEIPLEEEAPPLEEWDEEEIPLEEEFVEEDFEEEEAAEAPASLKSALSNIYVITGISLIVVAAIIILIYIIVQSAMTPFRSPIPLAPVAKPAHPRRGKHRAAPHKAHKPHPAEPAARYMKHYKKKGFKEEHIKAHLQKHGWPPHHVEWAAKKAREEK